MRWLSSRKWPGFVSDQAANEAAQWRRSLEEMLEEKFKVLTTHQMIWIFCNWLKAFGKPENHILGFLDVYRIYSMACQWTQDSKAADERNWHDLREETVDKMYLFWFWFHLAVMSTTELQQEMARSKERVFSELAEQQNQNAPILDFLDLLNVPPLYPFGSMSFWIRHSVNTIKYTQSPSITVNNVNTKYCCSFSRGEAFLGASGLKRSPARAWVALTCVICCHWKMQSNILGILWWLCIVFSFHSNFIRLCLLLSILRAAKGVPRKNDIAQNRRLSHPGCNCSGNIQRLQCWKWSHPLEACKWLRRRHSKVAEIVFGVPFPGSSDPTWTVCCS